MKLHYSPESQFVRKVMATAIEAGLVAKIELIHDKKDLEKHNPLLKRPCLQTEDGDWILDSPIICEYLAAVGGHKLLAKEGPARWRTLSQMALADGVMDAAGNVKQDETFHKAAPSKDWADKNWIKVSQGLDAFEALAKSGGLDTPTIGSLSIAICCGYLDYRHSAKMDWRKRCSALARWYEVFSKRPAIAETRPKAAVS